MLWREHHDGAVVRRLEAHALLGDFSQLQQRHHLKASAVLNKTVEGHE